MNVKGRSGEGGGGRCLDGALEFAGKLGHVCGCGRIKVQAQIDLQHGRLPDESADSLVAFGNHKLIVLFLFCSIYSSVYTAYTHAGT